MEDVAFDRDTGQLLAGSFMDYCMPRADDLPRFEVAFNEVPTPTNPIGAKGAGEAGTCGAPAAVMNAINDALSPLGAKVTAMPFTPARILAALAEG